MGLVGLVDLFVPLLAEAAQMRCTLQAVGRLGRLCLAGGLFPFDGVFNPPLHPAAF
jgi:hypothetical protein